MMKYMYTLCEVLMLDGIIVSMLCMLLLTLSQHGGRVIVIVDLGINLLNDD